jgi:hypothetical protein
MDVTYQFVNYGEVLKPVDDVLALDVGMKTIPGVIDHHHPQAEVECTASLIIKHPHLVLDHIKREDKTGLKRDSIQLCIITHRLPDFDSISSVFLALKLIETGEVDTHMENMARYVKMVDSATLPKSIDLTSTPYSILRSLHTEIKREKEDVSLQRMGEGLKFMNFLYSRSEEGYDIVQNRTLFSGIDRYERAIRRVENDYFNYLADVKKARKVMLSLPKTTGRGRIQVDSLIVKNPKSFLLREWARRDRENTSLRDGFSFLMTNFRDHRYILGVDPEKGVNLKGLGDLLNEREMEKRVETERPLVFRWYDGNCPFFNFRIIDSPQDGTELSQEEIEDVLLFFSQMGTFPKVPP